MPQVVVLERAAPQREALAYVLSDADVTVLATGDPAALASRLTQPELRCVIVAERDIDLVLDAHPELRRQHVPLLVLVEPGSHSGILRALELQADDILSRDRPSSDLVARILKWIRRHPSSGPITKEPDTAARGQMLRLIEQVCEDVARLQRRYEAELAHRRRVENALMESEAFYQSLVETLPLSLFRKDLEGRVTFANQLLCEAFKRPAAEILGKTDLDLFPKELAEKYRADDRQVVETRQTLETTEEFQTPSGERRYTHVVKSPVFDTSGKLIGVQGVFSDVTDRVRAEMALEQERFLLDSLMKSIPDNIYFKDAQGRYLRINLAKAAASGLKDPAEAIGRTDSSFFSPEHARQATADEQEVMQGGQPLIGKEERIEYPDGRVRWMSTTKLPLTDRDGKIIGTFGVSRDITPLKRAQAALQEAAAASEAANRAKSDFLANMSHEIRTPLNAVLGMTELVLETPLTPVQRDYLKLVHESGESLLTVINDILDFSKIEAGKLQIEDARFELREFLGDTLKSLGLRAHRKGLELACDIAADIPEVLVGDAHRLRQVVVNLVGNGIKFTDSGEVLLSVKRHQQSNGRIELEFCVTDTGIGIPQDKYATIFEAFEQADRSTTRRFGGTGLGLAISARLVELMGGRIWVESEIGRGSTFHFTIQFGEATDQPAHAPLAHPELLQGLRVLVVDDNSTNRRILAEMLGSWGMAPALASSAEEALAELRRTTDAGTPYGLVLTDVHMPGQSGFDLVRSTLASEGLCRGVIVMLTSGDRSDDLQTCQQLGVATYLIKPVKQSELFNAILQALGAAHTEEWKTSTLNAPRQTKRPLTILLAEDSSINQKLAVGLLERWGHRVVVADDGCIAVRKATSEPYDMVLMDIQMPELDGLGATQAIRAWEQSRGRHIPIVAMTAHALQGDRERCLSVGMDDYITKPIRAEHLFQMVEGIGATLTETVPVLTDPVAEIPSVCENGPPPEITTAASSVIDWPAARARTAGDEELLRDVASGFCEETPTVLQNLHTALDVRDWAKARRAAHTLKSSLGTFGVEHGKAAAERVESACRCEEPTVASGDLDQISQSITAALGDIAAYLHSPPSPGTIEAAGAAKRFP